MSDVDKFLRHYGVKGMKWGVINDDDAPGGGSGSSGTPSVGGGAAADPKEAAKAEAALRKYIIEQGGDPAIMKAKYGAMEPEPPAGNFYQRHKTAINIGAGVAVAGLAAYGGYKLNENLKGKKEQERQRLLDDEFERDVARRAKDKRDANIRRRVDEDMADSVHSGKSEAERILAANSKHRLLDHHNDLVAQRSTKRLNIDDLDTTPVTLKAGHIVKRVSTKNEDYIRPGGFYASHNDDDVRRYKAVLPTYWKGWGLKDTSGYVVNLKANSDVKAPSRREAYDIYERMVAQNPTFRQQIDPTGSLSSKGSKDFATETYRQMASTWADDDHPAVKQYFGEVKKAGYNALVDENDVGTLSKQPMRFLDGRMFSTEPSEKLSADDISRHQIEEARKLGLVD